MFGIIIAVHILICIFLILVILIQPGKGYGLSETFGGQAQTIFGTRAATFITRATSFSAAIFLLTCLSLAVVSGKKSRSIMDRIKSEGVKKEMPVSKEDVSPTAESSDSTATQTMPAQSAPQTQ